MLSLDGCWGGWYWWNNNDDDYSDSDEEDDDDDRRCTTVDKSVKSNNDRGHKLSPPRWWWGWWPTMMMMTKLLPPRWWWGWWPTMTMMTKLSPPRRWWGPGSKLWRSIFSIDEANSFLSRLLFIWYLYDILADYNPNHNITDCHSEKKKRKICAGLEVDGHDWTFADCVTCALIASLSTRRLHLYNGLWG